MWCIVYLRSQCLPVSTVVNFFISANYAKRNVVIIYRGSTTALTFNSQQALLHLLSSYLLPSNCIIPLESHKLCFVASVVRLFQLIFAFSHIILLCWQSEKMKLILQHGCTYSKATLQRTQAIRLKCKC